ncbi:hypothetical protein V2G26_013477 [Clonostachys chloroleuca]
MKDSICEEALVTYPLSPGTIGYHDTCTNPATTFGGSYAATQQAVYAGVPDYTVPTESRRHFSLITKQDKEPPVALLIVAAADCEAMLADSVVNMGAPNGVSDFVTKAREGKNYIKTILQRDF